MMSDDPRKLVRAGYDAIAPLYAKWAARIDDPARRCWTSFLLDTLPDGAPLLDLGCGNGLPSTRELAERVEVTGVDFSSAQLEAARRHVPGASFIQADLMDLVFPDASFAAITAFYSIIHLPREEQPLLFTRIVNWLQPGGYLVSALGSADSPGDIDPDWLGVPMYWSHYTRQTNEAIARDAGLEIVSSTEETILEDDGLATFHWLIGRKPPSQAATGTVTVAR